MKIIGDQKPQLIIDPGHGGKDPGASGNGIIEKIMTLDISLYQYKRFCDLGVKVALTRDSDVALDSTPRATLVKNSGAKYCISNHINAAPSIYAVGAEIIHSVFNNGKLAKEFAKALGAAGQVLRPSVTYSRKNGTGGDYYYMHRLTGNVTTVIVEYGFCTNVEDAARLKSNWKTYAEAVVKAYCQFVGHRYIPPSGTGRPPTEPPEDPKEAVDGFTDIAGHWALDSIIKANRAGVMGGVSVDRFAPDQPLSRAQAAVILDRLGLLGKEVK